MVEALPTLLDIAVREAVERILGKIKEGKKISDAEITLLLVGELAKRINALEKRVEEVKEDLSRRIDDGRDTMATRISALEKRVEEVKEDLSRRIEGLKSELSKRIDDSRDVMATRITALEKRVEGLEGRTEELESEVRGLRAEVSSIKSDVIILLKGWLEGKRGE